LKRYASAAAADIVQTQQRCGLQPCRLERGLNTACDILHNYTFHRRAARARDRVIARRFGGVETGAERVSGGTKNIFA
jgi:hypothetical protein